MAADNSYVSLTSPTPARGGKGILIHVLRSGSTGTKIWVVDEAALSDLDIPADLKEELKHFWLSRRSFFTSQRASHRGPAQNDAPVVIAERLTERRSLVIFGAGHVGYNVALIGAIIGLKVLLLDDREVFLHQARMANANIEVMLIDFNDIGRTVRIAKNAAVVIVTRGHQSDEVILGQVANFDAEYVGMIGSRRRVEGVFRRLREQGVNDSFLREVKAPIGLDIGAKTPQEIAVSVHAEIIKHFNGADVSLEVR
jgi:xanthine/CO dehydrogenase XdhC/CoxF family maturation factor